MRTRPEVRQLPRGIEELFPEEAEAVRGGQGTQLASVTDLIIDPFNPNRFTPRRWTAEHVEEVSS